MKRKLFVLYFLFMLFASAIFAQTPDIDQKLTAILSKSDSVQQKVYAVHDLLQTAANTRESLRAEYAQGASKLADLNTQAANYQATVARHNEAAASAIARTDAHDQRTNQHNANQCTFYEGHAQDCAGYNQEGANLNAEGAALDRENAGLNHEKEMLDAAHAGLQLEIDDYNKWKDDFNARNTLNETNINKMMRVLDMLQRTNQDCQSALTDPTATPERIHEACGGGFDGNGSHGPLTHGGTGGASRN